MMNCTAMAHNTSPINRVRMRIPVWASRRSMRVAAASVTEQRYAVSPIATYTAAEGERREGHRAGPGPPPGHLTPHLRRVPRRHGEKGRHGGQGIDDEEDRREYQEQVLERLQHALTSSPGSRGPCRPASPRTSP